MGYKETTDMPIFCYHCGDECPDHDHSLDDKFFCCNGCKLVYSIVSNNNLCTYYDLNKNPGQALREPLRKDKYAYLDDEEIERQLLSYADENQKIVSLHLPTMHCSSCLYLLENLHKISDGVLKTTVNFPVKDIEIVFDPGRTSLREIVETLVRIGYEPYISLNDFNGHKPGYDKRLIYKIGVAGFCFANIMLISFADYLGMNSAEKLIQDTFRIMCLILSLPVIFYSSTPFYKSAFGSLRNGLVNIDAPIVLAIWVTFIRSVYEVVFNVGSGYFDSMSGIVFFMLIGRLLQESTHRKLSFDRDYSSYFPVAVTILENNEEVPKQLPKIKVGDTMLIHNEELIPADGILTEGNAWIDYSFVTGESSPVSRETGEIIYAGGKQMGSNIELMAIKEVSQSYLTKLWDSEKNARKETEEDKSFVNGISRYFSIIVFAIAFASMFFWFINDSAKMWQVFTAVLIIACPCALLLSNTFTNGHILRILSKNGFFLKNAQVIENISNADFVVFDKTGTLTVSGDMDIEYRGTPLNDKQLNMVKALASQSTHPLSVALHRGISGSKQSRVAGFKEHPGFGIEGFCDDTLVSLGSKQFVRQVQSVQTNSPQVHLAFEEKYFGFFAIKNHYRSGLSETIQKLKRRFGMAVISGDSSIEEDTLRKVFGNEVPLYFNQKPHDKVEKVKELQESGKKVIMIGDGLNDGSALLAASVGIAVSDNSNNFTPASDAIIDAGSFAQIPAFAELCEGNKRIIMASFILSVVYNIFGIAYAISGNLSPMVAAILMPLSSVSILILSYGGSVFLGKKLGLKT